MLSPSAGIYRGLWLAALLSLWASAAEAQDEPGAAGQLRPASRPTAPSRSAATPGGFDAIAAAQRDCRPGVRCAHLSALLSLVHDPKRGPEVVALLAYLGDARAAPVLAKVAAYGADEHLRDVGRAALVLLAVHPAAKAALARIAERDGDAAIRWAAHEALRGGTRAPDKGLLGEEPTSPPAAKRRPRPAATQPNRVIFGQTALPRRPGSMTWAAYNIAMHSFEYTLNRHVELGIYGLVPVAVYGFLPSARIMFHPSSKVHLGVIGIGGIAGSYVGDGGGVGAYGGGGILTIGDEKLLLNAQVLVGGITPFGTLADGSSSTAWGMLASLGGSWQVHRRVRLNLELWMPAHPKIDTGRIWLISYGIRITGDSVFGGVAFVIPAYAGVEEWLKYVPLGIPLLSIGYQW